MKWEKIKGNSKRFFDGNVFLISPIKDKHILDMNLYIEISIKQAYLTCQSGGPISELSSNGLYSWTTTSGIQSFVNSSIDFKKSVSAPETADS